MVSFTSRPLYPGERTPIAIDHLLCRTAGLDGMNEEEVSTIKFQLTGLVCRDIAYSITGIPMFRTNMLSPFSGLE